MTSKKLLVVSHGGSATTAFMEFIKDYIPTNCSRDLDGLKHTIPSKIEDLPSRIIYIYGDMDKTMRSLFRRKGGNTSFASIHAYKIKGIKYSIDLPANFEDFEAYTKLVTLENREPVGCLVHMREWKKVPNVFFIHYEQICTSETIDEYLGIPKGTCSKFKVLPRESKVQPCETPEYLETMKGLDLRVQGIVTEQPHKTNILIVSFPRSGFHLLQTILESYFSIKECACQKNPDVKIITSVKEDIAYHRAHDMNLGIKKAQFNKTIILYRKDIVEQLDAFFRYRFRTFDTSNDLPSLNDHAKCHEISIPYSEKLDFFRTVLKQYNDWVEKWVTEPTPNSIIIEYSDFMKNPQITLDKIQEHLLERKDSVLSAKIVKELKIEYKHSITPEKYQELTKIILSLDIEEPPSTESFMYNLNESKIMHKTNILLVSFPRSGFNLLNDIVTIWFDIPLCGGTDSEIMPCSPKFYNRKIACHRSHDYSLTLKKPPFNKTIILYRKDVIEQLDSLFRYTFKDNKKILLDNSITKYRSSFTQTLCDTPLIPYSEKLDFLKKILKFYKDWVQKWVTEPSPNSIIIEYSDFMRNPQDALDKLQEHLLETKDSELSAKIVEELKIEYKHSMTFEKYKELANLLATLT